MAAHQVNVDPPQFVTTEGFSDRRPPQILCRVESVKFLAKPDTDEVCAKFRLIPLPNDNNPLESQDTGVSGSQSRSSQNSENSACSFGKILTQSDANGGGFSVPQAGAKRVFPPLDYQDDPPAQTLVVKDIHSRIWNFRHVYRGNPKRHMLQGGWSPFVNEKKLVAGDLILFFKSENGDINVGIRRAQRKAVGFVSGLSDLWERGNEKAIRMMETLKQKGEAVMQVSHAIACKLTPEGKPHKLTGSAEKGKPHKLTGSAEKVYVEGLHKLTGSVEKVYVEGLHKLTGSAEKVYVEGLELMTFGHKHTILNQLGYPLGGLELCRILQGHRYTKKLNQRQVSALLIATFKPPHQRENTIKKTVVGNNYSHDKLESNEFGMDVLSTLSMNPWRFSAASLSAASRLSARFARRLLSCLQPLSSSIGEKKSQHHLNCDYYLDDRQAWLLVGQH